MGTGLRGAVILTWAQTAVEGSPAEPNQELAEGMSWRWHGRALPLEGEGAALILMASRDHAELRSRASRVVRKMMQHPAPSPAEWAADAADPLFRDAVVVSDGQRFFTLIPIVMDGGLPPLWLCSGALPPPDKDLMIVRCSDTGLRPTASEAPEVICFTPGTQIETPRGPILVEQLRSGQDVLTRDDGPQKIKWIGQQSLTDTRLRASPSLRPIRIKGAQPLTVSPGHRILLSGDKPRALWGEDEVLVRAVDLLDLGFASIDHTSVGTDYIHVMLGRHSVIMCDALWTESFHPAFAALDTLVGADLARLHDVLPQQVSSYDAYGPPVRRMLSRAEAAVLCDGGPRGITLSPH